MRLSEDRISAIASKIAFELVKKRLITTTKNLRQVAAWVEKPILEDIVKEDEIDVEVRRILGTLTKCPPEGSFEYNAMFQKKKEEVAKRRGYAM
jgi:hypothetical protein